MRHTSLLLSALVLALPLATACQATPHSSTATTPSSADEAALRAVLAEQAEAWNMGDIDGFMEGYWQSPDLRFASGGTVTRGYRDTLAGYKARYTSREVMGTLDFSDLDVVKLSEHAAIVHGRWQLTRAEDTPSGLFTLVFRRIGGEWKIISDTTTSAD